MKAKEDIQRTAAVVRIESGSIGGAVRRALELVGGLRDIIKDGARVLLKPNLVAPFEKAVTSPDVIRAVADAVREQGGVPFIAESSGYEFDTGATFRILKISEFAAAEGIGLVNPEEDGFEEIVAPRGPLRRWEVARCALEADCIINLPKLKGHSLTGVTIGAKNLMGLVSRRTRKRMHVAGLSRAIAVLPEIFAPKLTIVDGSTIVGRAVFGVEEALSVIVASRDVLAADLSSLGVLGVDPQEVGHIRHALMTAGAARDVRVVGDADFSFPLPGLARVSWSKRGHRSLMWGLYVADLALEPLLGGKSLIPLVHYYLGIRPILLARRCDACGACVDACPAGAIDLKSKKIRSEICMFVRCMRCVEACPREAIRTVGLRKPK